MRKQHAELRIDESNDPDVAASGFASLVLPGIGQFLNGEILKGFGFVAGAIVIWGMGVGWIIHIWAAIDAARRAYIIADERQEIRCQIERGTARNE